MILILSFLAPLMRTSSFFPFFISFLRYLFYLLLFLCHERVDYPLMCFTSSICIPPNSAHHMHPFFLLISFLQFCLGRSLMYSYISMQYFLSMPFLELIYWQIKNEFVWGRGNRSKLSSLKIYNNNKRLSRRTLWEN